MREAVSALAPAGWALCLALAGCASGGLREPMARAALQDPVLRGETARVLETAGTSERALLHQRLRDDPADALAHFSLAAMHEAQARRGLMDARQLAIVGFERTLALDPSNPQAARQLGVLLQADGRHEEAVQWLGRAASLAPGDAATWRALASAAYAAGAVDLALTASAEAARLRPGDAELVARHALALAAAGENDAAHRRLDAVGAGLPAARAAQLEARLTQWALAHRALGVAALAAPAPAAPADAARAASTPAAALAPSGPGMAASPFISGFGAGGAVGNTGAPAAPLPVLMQAPPLAQGGRLPRMVQVDVTLIRAEETNTAQRGNNILETLQLQLAAGRTRTRTRTGTRSADDVTESSAFEDVVTRSLSIPAINYSLNIANQGDSRAEVVSRPSLVALDGQPANFFSGDEVSVATSGNFSSGLSDRSIGIELAVTPTFIDEDTVLLAVAASRGFVSEASLPAGSFAQALQVTRQRLITTVAVRFGETLVLSGLTERQFNRSHQGVPVLRDVPLVNNAFSRRDTFGYHKSVLMLLTPRRLPGGTGSGEQAGNAAQRVAALLALQVPGLPASRPTLNRYIAAMQTISLAPLLRPTDLPIEAACEPDCNLPQ